jgi:transcription antitermination factor NusG
MHFRVRATISFADKDLPTAWDASPGSGPAQVLREAQPFGRVIAYCFVQIRSGRQKTVTERAVARLDDLTIHPWFAVQVRSRHEKSVAHILSDKGLECFLPLCRGRRQWSDRVAEVDLPLFSGYVFCRMDLSKRMPVLTTPGIVRIVGVGRSPEPVEESEISAVQAIVQSGMSAHPWPMPQVGEWVAIDKGPLAGLEGALIGVKSQLRFVVSVTMLQRAVAVEVDGGWIRRVQRPQHVPHAA